MGSDAVVGEPKVVSQTWDDEAVVEQVVELMLDLERHSVSEL